MSETEPAVRPFIPEDSPLEHAASIMTAMTHALDSLPADAKGAVIAYADTKAVRAAVFARLSTGLSFVGTLGKEFAGPLDVSAQVRFVW